MSFRELKEEPALSSMSQIVQNFPHNMWWKILYHCTLIFAVWDVWALSLLTWMAGWSARRGHKNSFSLCRFFYEYLIHNLYLTRIFILKLKTLFFISSSLCTCIYDSEAEQETKMHTRKKKIKAAFLKFMLPLYFYKRLLLRYLK